MTLQLVHKEWPVRPASSLYCVWIRRPGKSGERPEMIWIDRGMNEFERQFEPAIPVHEDLPEGAVDEPGGSRRVSYEFVLSNH